MRSLLISPGSWWNSAPQAGKLELTCWDSAKVRLGFVLMSPSFGWVWVPDKTACTWTNVAGTAGSIPGPGRFHMPQGSYPCAPQLLKSVCPRAHAVQQEKSPQWEAHTQQQRPSAAKNKLKKKYIWCKVQRHKWSYKKFPSHSVTQPSRFYS